MVVAYSELCTDDNFILGIITPYLHFLCFDHSRDELGQNFYPLENFHWWPQRRYMSTDPNQHLNNKPPAEDTLHSKTSSAPIRHLPPPAAKLYQRLLAIEAWHALHLCAWLADV